MNVCLILSLGLGLGLELDPMRCFTGGFWGKRRKVFKGDGKMREDEVGTHTVALV